MSCSAVYGQYRGSDFLNKKGGKIKTLHDLTRQSWHWCMAKNIWISTCHVAGVENKEAAFLSKDKNSDMEWMLNTEVFQLAQKIFEKCDIDLIASKDNHQLSKYILYLPDKYSEAVDALRISWTNLKSYICCPVSVFTQVSCKIERDNAEGIVLAPIWPTQTVAFNLSGLIYTAEKERFVSVTEKFGTTTSTAQNETRCILFIRESIKNTEIPDETNNIINASWRDSTKQQYRNYHQKWLQFCSKKTN